MLHFERGYYGADGSIVEYLLRCGMRDCLWTLGFWSSKFKICTRQYLLVQETERDVTGAVAVVNVSGKKQARNGF